MRGTWVGVLLGLLGAALTNLGLTLQKLSLTKEAQRVEAAAALGEVVKPRSVVCQRWWLCGFAVFALGQLSAMIALGFAAQEIIATMSSFGLVCNLLFARLLLGERFHARDLLSTALIIAGSTAIVLGSVAAADHFASAVRAEAAAAAEASTVAAGGTVVRAHLSSAALAAADEEYDLPQLLRLFRKPTAIAMFCTLALAAVAVAVWVVRVNAQLKAAGAERARLLTARRAPHAAGRSTGAGAKRGRTSKTVTPLHTAVIAVAPAPVAGAGDALSLGPAAADAGRKRARSLTVDSAAASVHAARTRADAAAATGADLLARAEPAPVVLSGASNSLSPQLTPTQAPALPPDGSDDGVMDDTASLLSDAAVGADELLPHAQSGVMPSVAGGVVAVHGGGGAGDADSELSATETVFSSTAGAGTSWHRRQRERTAIGLAFVSSILGATSILLAKCCMHLIRVSISAANGAAALQHVADSAHDAASNGDPAAAITGPLGAASHIVFVNEFAYGWTYALFATFLLLAVASIHVLNLALARAPALFIVPIYYALSLVITIAMGLVYFRTARALLWGVHGHAWQHWPVYAFLLGVCVDVYGVVLTAKRGGTTTATSTGAAAAGKALSTPLSAPAPAGPAIAPAAVSGTIAAASSLVPASPATDPSVGLFAAAPVPPLGVDSSMRQSYGAL